MYAQLLKILGNFANLDEYETELIKSSFKPHSLLKGEFFLKEGTVCKNVGFLYKGLVRYFVHKDGEESTFEFTCEGEFIGDYQSFRNASLSVQNIQAIEDCEMLIIDYPKIQNIYNTTNNGNLIGRQIITHRFEIMVNQILEVYMQNHEDRYTSFIDKYYGLTQRIPQYLIASYVGVKPESLSRIRRRFAKNIS
ncbi:Crp/Fnr family transcriptional regulator [Lutimonas saemankumensis]|uniref:Crp/Fnr family transcriptional regulator n=1 Tax=Lutimonas saemankumensis TaxID=483016 RepID=UPI001CD5DCD6|nr:Crp/Fnr family transcriptional regulator [Lutimonas saemankumensis]MCA0933263.1 Crp/Fnr family transcriptional regulator [Lutimonas saemankumensis]